MFMDNREWGPHTAKALIYMVLVPHNPCGDSPSYHQAPPPPMLH